MITILFELISLVIIFIIHLFIGQCWFKKRLKIKNKHNFIDGRNKLFLAIEYGLISLFIITGIVVIKLDITVYISPSALIGPGLFFIMFTIQGIEEWVLRREEKVYYYRFLTSVALIALMVTFTIRERIAYL